MFTFKLSGSTESGRGIVNVVLLVGSEPLFVISITYSALSVGFKLLGEAPPLTVVAVKTPSGSGI